MSQDWLSMTAAELGAGIGRGEIDPEELAEAHLDAIATHPDAARIYTTVTPERARAEAAASAARARAGLRRGPLDGVPISWKDLFDTSGLPTEAGSALLKGRIPAADATVLRNATHAGLVCIGKTHMSELAFSGLGVNPVTATPPNRHNPSAAPGGSSSGAAASVAFGLAAAGIGSDTGGSVRIPSAWNGLVGLKTTHGRLSCEGVVPLCPRFDTVGPLCRSVGDAALLLAALEGGRAADLAGATLAGRRLLVLETVAQDDLRDAPRQGFARALDAFAAAGAVLLRGEVPSLAEAMALSPVLFATEAYGVWKNVIEAAPGLMFHEILDRFRGGAQFAGAEYVAAWQTLGTLRAAWAEATAGFDAVLVPTSPIAPPDAARLLTDSAYYQTENLLALRNTRIANLMGLSALTLPTGVPAAGVSLMGAPGGEERLLRLGAAAEAALAA